MKYHTIQNPPLSKGETFKNPTMTRASDYVSIEAIFAKYGFDVQMNPVVYRPITELSPEEEDILRNSTPLDELEDEDIVIQQRFVEDTIAALSPKKKDSKKEEVEEPTQVQPAPEKPATEPENASK